MKVSLADIEQLLRRLVTALASEFLAVSAEEQTSDHSYSKNFIRRSLNSRISPRISGSM